MAGILKPNDNMKEANYKYIDGIGGSSSKPTGLFNGVSANEFNTGNVMFWNDQSSYVEIEVFEDFNLWRSGTTSWSSYNNPLKILKYIESTATYTDVTSVYSQTLGLVTNNEWEKTLNSIPKGRYKFQYDTGNRLDSEWFIELVPPVVKVIVSNNDSFYSLDIDEVIYETDMKSNTAPSPLVASANGSESNGSFLPWKSFSITNKTNPYWLSNVNRVGWIQIDYGELRKVNLLKLSSINSSSFNIRFPKKIEILASVNGVDFDTLSIFDDILYTRSDEQKEFKFNNDNLYRYYRLNVDSKITTDRVATGKIQYGYKKATLNKLPSSSEYNFINYGSDLLDEFDSLIKNKDYVLQNETSRNSDDLLTTQLDRKPLSISFK